MGSFKSIYVGCCKDQFSFRQKRYCDVSLSCGKYRVQCLARATEYLKQSIEIYSKNYFEYPWNSAVNIGGMWEWNIPGLSFDYTRKKESLWHVITHEIGHNWFP